MTITAVPTGVVGTPMYAWDLDFNGATSGPAGGPCETAPSSDPSITITRPAGAFRIRSCVGDSQSALPGMICEHAFLVGPKPAVSVEWGEVDLDTFHRQGITAVVGWSPAMTTTYTADYITATTPPQIFGDRVHLTVSSARRPDGRDLVTISPPPAAAVKPYVPGVNQAPYVTLAPASVSDPYSGFMFLDGGFLLPTYGWWPKTPAGGPGSGQPPTTRPAPRDPRTRVVSARRVGQALAVAIVPGAASGRRVSLGLTYRIAGARRTLTRQLRLGKKLTQLRWVLPSRVWRAGSGRLAVTARFSAGGVTYRTPAGRELAVRWPRPRAT